MKTLLQRLEEGKAQLLRKCGAFPNIVIVLGSGLSGLNEDLEVEAEIPFHELPNVQKLTVEGHVGRLVIGRLGNTRVACMLGRLHYYEGYSMEEVVFPVRLLAHAGASCFLLTNASGGLHAHLQPPELVLIKDHINLMGTNPLIGKNEEALGPRFPDMSCVYDPIFNRLFLESAKRLGISLKEGVYLALHGPTYETPSEIKMYRLLGGDIVGMSTVPEVIVLRHMSKRVVALSCVTNSAAGVGEKPLVHAEVLENAKKSQRSLSMLIRETVPHLEKICG